MRETLANRIVVIEEMRKEVDCLDKDGNSMYSLRYMEYRSQN